MHCGQRTSVHRCIIFLYIGILIMKSWDIKGTVSRGGKAVHRDFKPSLILFHDG